MDRTAAPKLITPPTLLLLLLLLQIASEALLDNAPGP
jgi:hypothetical protein